MVPGSIARFLLILLSLSLAACDDNRAPNNPHTDFQQSDNIRFAVFTESPKTLDPARSYSSNEIRFTAQIVEPMLQYDYLQRPYTLTPLTLREMPTITAYDKNNQQVDFQDKDNIAYTVYDLHLTPNRYYQPHPAFARKADNQLRYHQLTEADLDPITTLQDFFYTDTRALTAHDYAYQIKRLADPKVRSPIYGLMSEHIVGLKTLNKQLQEEPSTDTPRDMRKFECEGIKVMSDTHLQIKVHQHYAQFIYWLAMPFFSPIPWEADHFYQQAVLKDKNITLDWYPVGTGPYQLSENNPNSRMILSRNPNYRGETYDFGEGDKHVLPMVDTHVFSLEKESIPQWTKFLQGYYDISGISADSFDQAIQIDPQGQPSLTNELATRGIKLYTTIEPAIYYMGFNMMDDVVGGQSERARKLRHAIQLAIDYDEYISIFLNGRGIPAHGPIPPGIFAYQETKQAQGDAESRLKQARALMREAGYPNGIDPNTKQALILNYDVTASGGAGEKAVLNWMRKQFAKLGVQLHVRATQYNRFQEKMRNGNAQIFSWGWLADYPDPENFLFLFYGPNGKMKFQGENASNYQNQTFDTLFETMRDMPNGPERLDVINQMVTQLQFDAPWVWGFHPKRFELAHSWVGKLTPNAFANNTLKYMHLDARQRVALQNEWNKPLRWPGLLIGAALLLFICPVIWQYHRRGNTTVLKKVKR